MSVFIKRKYKVHPLRLDRDYGLDWTNDGRIERPSQLAIELRCFHFATTGESPGKVKSRFYHGLNIVRLLWPHDPDVKDRGGFKGVSIFKHYTNPKTGEKHLIWNNYFLEVFKFLCQNKRAGLTGCASSGKTFTTSVYALICYYSSPSDTTVMVSTTSGSSSERRVWGDIKMLHTSAKWKENDFYSEKTNEVRPIGHIIEYLKCLTLEQESEINSRKNAVDRNLRNGLMVIPIAEGKEGEKALKTIIGTHTEFVLWIIDELPEMMEGVLRPRTNLNFNPWFQLIGIGNAKLPNDPHGDYCKPRDGGFETYTLSFVEANNIDRWPANSCNVLFLHGERSPNYHPDVYCPEDQDELLDFKEFPYPKLSNPSANIQTAIDSSPDGDLEEGKKTIDYNRFAIGYWVTSGLSNTILSIEQVKKYKCHEPLDTWSYHDRRKYASCDASFTVDGDECIAAIAEIGFSIHNKEQCKVTVHKINPTVQDIEEHGGFKQACAALYAKLLLKENVAPENACLEAMQDGGQFLLYVVQSLAKELGTSANSLHAIQSLGASTVSERYDNLVTEYWYDVPLFVSLGIWKEFEISSKYCYDFCNRQYESVGKGKVKVEKKKDMKERIGRSPDHGDAVAYLVHMLKIRGEVNLYKAKRVESQLTETSSYRPTIDDYILGRYQQQREEKVLEFAEIPDDEEYELF